MPIAGMGLGGAALLGGAISGGASILGGIMGADASQKAAELQLQGQQQGLAQQQAMFNQAYGLVSPYATQGLGPYNQLSDLYGIPYSNAAGTSEGGPGVSRQSMQNFMLTPDYRFAFNQGLQALDRSAAGKGSLLSGGQVKGAQEFGQGLASQQYSNYFNRLLSLAQIGQSAASGAMAPTVQAAGQIGNTLSSMGATQAAGTIGANTSLVGGIQGASTAATQALMLPAYANFIRPQTAAPTTPGVSPITSYQPVAAPVSSPLGAVPTNPYTGLGIGGV